MLHPPFNLDKLLRGQIAEWERLEFKAGWNPETILHTLCSFANDFHNLGGGYIVLGIAEKDGRPVLPPAGLDPALFDGIQKELLELSNSSIRPHYLPVCHPCEYQGKPILVIHCFGGDVRPYKAKIRLGKDKSDWAYFIRKNSSTVRAKDHDEAELLSISARIPFDDRVNHHAKIDELSRDLMLQYLKAIGSGLAEEAVSLSTLELARRLQVVGGPAEHPKPLNIGLLFFHSEPHKFFPQAQIDIVDFPDGPGGDRFSEKIFRGPIHLALKDALNYLERHFIHDIVIKHNDRPESTRCKNYPLPALEEALANAVYHKGYDTREPIEVRITPEDLVIINYPGPDRSVSITDLRQGRALPRHYRNRRIGEFLKELDLTEGRSTGIPKILRILKANGSPIPEFITNNDHDHFLTRFFPVVAEFESAPESAPERAPKSAPKSAPKKLHNKNKSRILTKKRKNQKVLLRSITLNPDVTIDSLAQKLKLSARTVDKLIQELKSQGRLHRIGPLKGGHWQVGQPPE